MKQYILSISLCAAVCIFTACTEDKLSSESVVKDDLTQPNDFDKWIEKTLTEPYNITFKYKYNDNETDMSYYNVPADYKQAVKLAHIIKHTCIDVYDKVAGKEFTKTYFPKLFYATGEFQYRNNGTMILGTAEGGKKIFLAGVNNLDNYMNNLNDLNEYYLKTIHHEFTHILNQTKNYQVDYEKVTANTYVSDAWSKAEYNGKSVDKDNNYIDKDGKNGYLKRGYITAYSQKEPREDYAEMLSTYVTNTPEQWKEWIYEAADLDPETKEPRAKGHIYIMQKLEMVRKYLKDEFDIDIDQLRNEVLKSEQEVISGKVDLTNLAIKK